MGHLFIEEVEPPNLSLLNPATVEERREAAVDVGGIKASFFLAFSKQKSIVSK